LHTVVNEGVNKNKEYRVWGIGGCCDELKEKKKRAGNKYSQKWGAMYPAEI
jgi:hypothetical protein